MALKQLAKELPFRDSQTEYRWQDKLAPNSSRAPTILAIDTTGRLVGYLDDIPDQLRLARLGQT